MRSIFLTIVCLCFAGVSFSLYAQESDSTKQPEKTVVAPAQTSENEELIISEPEPAKPDSAMSSTSETAAPAEGAVIEEDDENLIIEDEDEQLISDDSEELIIADEKTVKKDTTVVPQQQIPQPQEQPQEVQQQQGVEPQQQTVVEDSTIVKENEQAQVVESRKPAAIEKERLINFDKNLKNYRSPKRAMLMSLLVPGLGQAYSKKYWKTAMFGVLEAACIGFAVKFKKDGDHQIEAARDFADVNFTPQKFFNFYSDFQVWASAESLSINDVSQMFGDSLSIYQKKYSNIIGDHNSEDRQGFDQAIGDTASVFVQGWNDCEPDFTVTGFNYADPNNEYAYIYKAVDKDTLWIMNMYKKSDTTHRLNQSALFGYSAYQHHYSHLMSEANKQFNISSYFIFALLANHVASAIDAFITARAYNDKLLNEQSLWRHININHQVAYTKTGGVESRIDLRIQF